MEFSNSLTTKKNSSLIAKKSSESLEISLLIYNIIHRMTQAI